jgi:hypothetical protein
LDIERLNLVEPKPHIAILIRATSVYAPTLRQQKSVENPALNLLHALFVALVAVQSNFTGFIDNFIGLKAKAELPFVVPAACRDDIRIRKEEGETMPTLNLSNA